LKYKAVIFDLFGTLIPGFPEVEYRQVLEKMAVALSVPPADFLKFWFASFNDSALGVLPGFEAKISQIGNKMGTHFTQDQISEASQMMSSYAVHCLQPRSGATQVLSQLKYKGLKLGLISDCFSDTPELWPTTSLAPLIDVPVFSCLVGIRKPDPRIYYIAVQQLGVRSQDCLYVGDGSSSELTGAVTAGMQAVQLYISGEKDAYRVDRDIWDGKIILSLTEIMPLVD
jgi:putative hydrolase of the HAD superfamily